MKTINFMKTILALLDVACVFGVSAQNVTYPFPGEEELILEEPVGESAWYSRNCTKYMHLLGPLEYGGESSVPSKIVIGNDGTAYIGNVFTDFSGSGWLKGSRDTNTDDITLKFPQIVFDETYDGERYYYYACRVGFNKDKTDLEVAENQTLILKHNGNGNYVTEDNETAIGICYVYDPSIEDQAAGIGHEGCELKWFGIAYADMEWSPVNELVTIPEGLKTQRYALCHSSGAAFVDLAESNGKIFIAGLTEDGETCIVGDISSDENTVTFATNQFLGVENSGEFFRYMVAAASDAVTDSETGEIVNTIAPAETFIASLDPTNKSLAFITPETGFAITNGQSKVGGGDLYLEPRLTPQSEYVIDSPEAPEIVAYSPYDEALGYGTFNFNLPSWTNGGLLIDPANMFYNIYVDDELLTLTPGNYLELSEELTDIPYDFSDGYDIFSVGINHAIYLYSGNYDRIGIQSFVVAEDGSKIKSPVVYNKEVGLDTIGEESKMVSEIYYLDLSGKRIRHFDNGFAIKCTRFADGSIKTEKIVK